MFNTIESTYKHPNLRNSNHVSSVCNPFKLIICLLGLFLIRAEPVFAQTITEVTWQYSNIPGAAIALATRQTTGARIVFKVRVDDLPVLRTVYLGCSYLNEQGREIDLEVREIRRILGGASFEYRVPFDAESIVFTLWERKITRDVVATLRGAEYREVMASDNVSEFKDRVRRLEEMGYFMLGRINSTGWLSLTNIKDPEQLLGGTLYQ